MRRLFLSPPLFVFLHAHDLSVPPWGHRMFDTPDCNGSGYKWTFFPLLLCYSQIGQLYRLYVFVKCCLAALLLSPTPTLASISVLCNHFMLNSGKDFKMGTMGLTFPKLPFPSTLWNTRWLRVRRTWETVGVIGAGLKPSCALFWPPAINAHLQTQSKYTCKRECKVICKQLIQ